MGFFNTLEKVFNGVEDFAIKTGDWYAKKIDRMTDKEIEKRYSKSADEVRMNADMLKMKSEMAQMNREKRMMQGEIARMEQEQFYGYNKKDKLGK